jgi:hypothetical protein
MQIYSVMPQVRRLVFFKIDAKIVPVLLICLAVIR